MNPQPTCPHIAQRPVRFGVIGIHGYSRQHLAFLQAAARRRPERVELVAAYAHAREQDPAWAEKLEAQGLHLTGSLDELLGGHRLDVVTVPTGIALHVPLARRVLEAGLTPYVEKPAAGTVELVQELIDAGRRAGRMVFVGFQECFRPSTRVVKQILLEQRYGGLKRIVSTSAWPRPASYYARNNWAGRLHVGQDTVLDSPLNNACSHFMNLPLFLAGQSPEQTARPVSLEAELYRANPIESFDTCGLRVRTETGCEIVFHASHACQTPRGPRIRIECERARILLDFRGPGDQPDWQIQPLHGPAQSIPRDPGHELPFEHVADWLSGQTDTPVFTAEQALAHTQVVNAAHRACPIRTVDAGHCMSIELKGEAATAIHGMDDLLQTCYERACLLGEACTAAWIGPPGRGGCC